MQYCSRCREKKTFECYYDDVRTRNGKASRCIQCCIESAFESKYGITTEQYKKMHEDQNGLCAICNELPKGKRQRGTLHIDHDHATGQIRGLVCASCNNGLGHFKDSIKILQAAIEYLKRSAESKETRRTLKSVS